jgi:hypothetical protein
MEQISNYKQIVGTIGILAGVIAAACIWLGAHAVEYNFDAFSDPSLVLSYAHNYKAAYWFLLLDMAGYYLLLLPIIFYLHQQYKYHSPWVPLLTFSGLGYVFTGAIGAAILISVWPDLMQQYSAPGADQPSISLIFNTITTVVTKGLWNILEVLFAAIWWIGFGVLLNRDQKGIGRLSVLAGISCLADTIGTVAGWKLLSEVGVNLYLVLGIVWPITLGLHLFRKSSSQVELPASTHDTLNNLKKETHVA